MSASLNMSDVQSLIGDLQAEAVKPSASVTNLLRIAKIAATKLNLQDALVWIDRELKGYMDLKIEDLPPYRRLTGVPKGYNPYHGWQPIHFQDPETSKFFSEAPIGEALGAIEETIRGKSDGTYTFPYPPELKRRVQQALSHPADVHIELAYGQLWNIIDQVRNLILNWALELEKAGVIGKNMQFSESEKGHAGPVTQHFFIQNVGILGNVGDQASVSSRQSATVSLRLDLQQVSEVLRSARLAISSLSESEQKEAQPILNGIESELMQQPPSMSKIRECLISLRRVFEGAAGSITAQGVIVMIRILLGSELLIHSGRRANRAPAPVAVCAATR
jgi:AbiTii